MKITLSLIISYLSICFQTFGQDAIVSSDLNLRNLPSLNGQIITVILKSSHVNVAECSNGWCYISFSSYEGFVRKSYLKNKQITSKNEVYSTNAKRYYRNSEGSRQR